MLRLKNGTTLLVMVMMVIGEGLPDPKFLIKKRLLRMIFNMLVLIFLLRKRFATFENLSKSMRSNDWELKD